MTQGDDAGMSKDDIMAELYASMKAERSRRRKRFWLAAAGIMAVFAVVGTLLPDDAEGGDLTASDTCQDFTESDFPQQLRFLTDEAEQRGSGKSVTGLQGTVSYMCANGLDRELREVMNVALGGSTATDSTTTATDSTTTATDSTTSDSVEGDNDPSVMQNGNILSGGDFCKYIPVDDVEAALGASGANPESTFPFEFNYATAQYFPDYTAGRCDYHFDSDQGTLTATFVTNADVAAGFERWRQSAGGWLGTVEDLPAAGEADAGFVVENPGPYYEIGLYGSSGATFLHLSCPASVSQGACSDLAEFAFNNVRG